MTSYIRSSLLAAIAACLTSATACGSPGSDWVAATPAADQTGPKIHITGVVRRSELEGGFYAIHADDGVTYDPTNLPEEFQKDGLGIEAEARRRVDAVGIHQTGPIIQLERIRRRAADGQPSEDSAPASAPSPASKLTDRVWMRADSTGLPGVMRIFLSDGTLVMDSCWETYRLSRWQKESDSTLRWQEDAATIRATIRSLSDAELVLVVSLRNGSDTQRYQPAPVPYLCPDMKR